MSLPNTIVLVHGDTEYLLFDWIRSSLKTDFVIHPKLGSGHTISMKGVAEVLSSPPFDRTASLHSAFRTLDYDESRRELVKLRVYPVLDVDGDTASFRSYASRDAFRDVPLRNNIYPVYNNPNLESVLSEVGLDVNHDLKSFRKFLDRQRFDDFRERISGYDRNSSNMIDVVDHLRSQVPRYQCRA